MPRKLVKDPVSKVSDEKWCYRCGKFTQHLHLDFTTHLKDSDIPDHVYVCTIPGCYTWRRA